MGAPTPYPNAFPLFLILGALASVVGGVLTHVLEFALFGYVISIGVMMIASEFGAPVPAMAGLVCFALCNPWTYTELVAGHGFSLFGYGGSLVLASCLVSRRPHERRLLAVSLCLAVQVQFALISLLGYLLFALRCGLYRVLCVMFAFTLPLFVSAIAYREEFARIPYLVDWENQQSVDPTSAAFLRGYFTGYDSVLPVWGHVADGAFSVIAALGFLYALYRKDIRDGVVGAVGLLFLLAAGGIHTPLRPVFVWIVQHLRVSGVFRELYDLVAFVAIALVLLCASSSSKLRGVSWLLFLAGAAVVMSWLSSPPAQYWIEASALTESSSSGASLGRVLLVPGVQPMTFEGRGSGLDPQLNIWPSGHEPINSNVFSFPSDAIIGSVERQIPYIPVGSVGVGAVIDRSHLRTDYASLAGQLALPVQPTRGTASSLSKVPLGKLLPLVSLSEQPRLGTVAATPGSGNVNFADARAAADNGGSELPATWAGMPRLTPFEATARVSRASAGWVESSLGFFEEPRMAQGIGGVLTTSPNALIDVKPGAYALCYLKGELVAGAQVVARSDPTLHWIRFPASVHAVACRGLCELVAQAQSLPQLPTVPPVALWKQVPFREYLPWLYEVWLPAGNRAALRLDMNYAPGWRAVSIGSSIHRLAVPTLESWPHLRLDTATNGWIVPARVGSQRLWIVEEGAAYVFVAEVALVAMQLAIGILLLNKSRIRRHSA